MFKVTNPEWGGGGGRNVWVTVTRGRNEGECNFKALPAYTYRTNK